MRRALGFLLKALLLVAALCAALWLFMPWREVGTAALSLGAPQLEKQGVRLRYSDVEAVDGGFTVNGLSLSGMVSLNFDSITLRPQLLASLMSLAPACEVSFRGGSLTLGQSLTLGNGGLLLTASPGEVLLERLHTDGDLSVQGFLAVDTGQMRIGRAEASVKVPASFEGNMETLRGFLPLVREGNNWFLRRARSDGGNN